jgi:hypothetical protein
VTSRSSPQGQHAYPPYHVSTGKHEPQFPTFMRPRRSVGIQATGGRAAEQTREVTPTQTKATVLSDRFKAEVAAAQRMLVEKLTVKYSSLQRAFRACDADGSGTISRREFEACLETLNIHTIRKPVIDHLFALIDYDRSGEFDFSEFTRVLMSPDVFNMEAVHKKVMPKVYDHAAAEERKRELQRLKAAAVEMTVEEYCEYYNIKEIPV